MITTNMPQLIYQLSAFAEVDVHDRQDSILLRLRNVHDLHRVDELLCDAVFADPLMRRASDDGWTVHLAKRAGFRGASDIHVVPENGSMRYKLTPAA